jgi:hypothetical protein
MNDTPSTITAALREAADLLDQHPDLPRPCIFAYTTGSVEVTWQLMNDDDAKDDQRAVAQRIVRAIGGKWDKNPWGDRFDLERKYRGLKLQIYTHREQVCERVVTGVETITIPAKPAEPEQTIEREKVEWRCQPLLAVDQADAMAVSA